MNEIKIIKRPEWINLYEKFKDKEHDEIITYDELNFLLNGGDIRKNKRYVFESFKKEMRRQQSKCIENIRNTGFRIVKSNEHVRLTNKEIKRAEKRARIAVEIILSTNMDNLTDREQAIARLAAARVQPILANLVGEQRTLKEVTKYELPKIPR